MAIVSHPNVTMSTRWSRVGHPRQALPHARSGLRAQPLRRHGTQPASPRSASIPKPPRRSGNDRACGADQTTTTTGMLGRH